MLAENPTCSVAYLRMEMGLKCLNNCASLPVYELCRQQCLRTGAGARGRRNCGSKAISYSLAPYNSFLRLTHVPSSSFTFGPAKRKVQNR